MSWLSFLFSFKGRVGQRAYGQFAGLAFVVFILSVMATPPTLEFILLPILLLLWPLLAVGAKRLHDYGKPEWWLVAWFLPIPFGVALFVSMISTPGDMEANRYGAPPPR